MHIISYIYIPNSAHGLHLLTLAARTAAAASPKTAGVGAPASFQTLCQAALPRWAFLVDLAIAIKVSILCQACVMGWQYTPRPTATTSNHHTPQCFGVAVSYLVIVGDLMPLAVREWSGHPTGGKR
jgi:amino acid permease